MDGLLRDLRYALRTLARAPTFTMVAVATLGLGIGANTAVFSVVDGVLLRPLPYEEPDALVTVWLDMSERGGPVREWFTPADLVDYRAAPGLFEELGAWGPWAPTLTELSDPVVLTAAVVTEGTLDRVFRAQPFLGRAFLPEEDLPGAAGAVVLSHAFWRDRMGADASVLGRTVVLNEQPFAVVGVMPEGFDFPFVPGAELWASARLDPGACGRGCYTIRTVARLAAGVTPEVARQRASALAARLAAEFPDTNARVGAAVFGLRDDLVGTSGRALWVLFGAVGFVLLIACTNVANLLLARGAAREGEFAVRIALGAGRLPLLRQLLAESGLLAAMGAVLGVTLAAWGTTALTALAPVNLPGLSGVAVDGRVLRFTAGVALGTALLFGFAPAARASRGRLQERIARVRVVRLTGGLRGGLVVAQVAMAMVLLVGAGLLTRTLQRLHQTELGYDPEGVLTVGVALPAARFSEGADRIAFYEALLARIEALPGVISAGGTQSFPLAGNDGDATFRIEGVAPPLPPDANVAWVRPVTRGYFYTMGQRILDGREFEERDHAAAPPVVIVNEMLARRHFDYPRGSPIGARIAFGSGPNPIWRTVVGITADTRHFGLRDGTRPAVYFSYQQVPRTAMTMVLRTDRDPNDLVADTRAAITAIDPALAAANFAPMTELVEGAVVTERFAATVLGVFAALALVLAAVGLYGVVSYGVTRRLREMGIRLALGAAGEDVRRMVLGGSLALTGVGVVLGALGALALTGVLEALLYDVPVNDPLTFAITTLVLTAVALVASWLPARRAGRANPVSILREN